jgi:hypothetical protein
MDLSRKCVIFFLNCIARKRPIAVWDDMKISASEDPQVIARRSLGYWYEEREGHLVPLVKSDSSCLVPDEVIIREPRGKVLARWTIVDEINARFSNIA